MTAQVVRHNPMLADNEKTVAYLKGMVGEDKDKINEIEEWGARRLVRITALRKFVAFLAKNGILEEKGKRMEGIVAEFTIEQCFAIATKYGLDAVEYKFYDSQSGVLTGNMHVDLQAVLSVPIEPPTDIFKSDKEATMFLDAIRGKDVLELGKMAKSIVLTEKERIYA